MNDENLTFVSASEYGSIQGVAPRSWGHSTPWTQTGFVPTDFAGMNTNVEEPISPATNTLGYPQGTGLVVGVPAYRNDVFVPNVTGDYKVFGAATMFNALILHRQGPYGWPTWKQLRVGSHPVVRYWNKNSTVSYGEKTSVNLTAFRDRDLTPNELSSLVNSGDNYTFQFTESALSNRYKPLQHCFMVEQAGTLVNLNLNHSYGNLKGQTSNQKFNLRLVFPDNFKNNFDPIYDDLKRIYIDKDFGYPTQTAFKSWISFNYTENIYPKQSSTYLSRTRNRINYSEVDGLGSNGIDNIRHRTFWKNVSSSAVNAPIPFEGRNVNTWDLSPRFIRTTSSLSSLGSNMGQSGTLPAATGVSATNITSVRSVWALDTSLQTGSAFVDGTAVVGELGFRPTQQTIGGFYTGLQYCTRSVGLYRHDLRSEYSGTYTQYPVYATDLISGKQPFFNSYNDFIEDVRGIAKDYSIMPEFKISDHMEYYIDAAGGNFLAQNDAFLSLVGGSITSSATDYNFQRFQLPAQIPFPEKDYSSGINSDFFVEYSHSDFLKYFKKFSDDHKEEGVISSYSFKMSGVKKLLPYNGFYPHQRAIQLASILSQSFAANLDFMVNSDGDLMPNAGLNAFMRPFFNPGIGFNSLKSSLAVDFPLLTGSLNYFSSTNTGGSIVPYPDSNNPDFLTVRSFLPTVENVDPAFAYNVPFRLPFEAIINPAAYLPRTPDYDPSDTNPKSLEVIRNDEVTLGNWTTTFGTDRYINNSSFAVYSGQNSDLYTLAANNFFGEVPKFFLEDQKLTSFTSKPESTWTGFTEGVFYYMDVVLKKPKTMVSSEGDSGNLLRGSTYGNAYFSSHSANPALDPAYAAYTPPYFYEDSIARILYVQRDGEKPTLNKILSEAVIETTYTGSSGYLGLNDIASRNKMKLSSSINLFGTLRQKQVTYSGEPGPDGEFIPIAAEDPSSGEFDVWSIATKFECPSLDFSGSTQFHSASGPRGLWGGVGSIPKRDRGIFLQIRESFPRLQGTAAAIAATGSLIDLCGFRPASKRIGRLAPSKTISEAIVAIPFTWDGRPPDSVYADTLQKVIGGKTFFSIDKDLWKDVKRKIDKGDDPSSVSVGDLCQKMKKYNLPPLYDFSFASSIDPFVMYIFEFEHTLDQEDLKDIWQGLMPKISLRAELDESVLDYPTGNREFFGSKDLPPNTRWMLFKIKRKAEKSYYNVTEDSLDDSLFKFKFQKGETPLQYNYNWPYDFFSLVELTKMDADVEFKPKPLSQQAAQLLSQGTAQAAAPAAISAGGSLGGNE